MNHKSKINIRWITHESDAESLCHEIECSGSVRSIKPWEPDPDSLNRFSNDQFGPMVAITGAVATDKFVKRVFNMLLKWNQPGGLMIDTRGKNIDVYPTAFAPQGSMVVAGPEGDHVQVFLSEDRDLALKMLPNILETLNVQ